MSLCKQRCKHTSVTRRQKLKTANQTTCCGVTYENCVGLTTLAGSRQGKKCQSQQNSEREKRNKIKCVWIPLKLKPEQNVSLSSCSIFCWCAWWEGWRKKQTTQNSFFLPSPNSGLRAGTDNLTAQIEHNFLTDDTERWRTPPPVHGRQPNTFPVTLCYCPAPAWAKSLTLLAGNRVSAASVVAAGVLT